MARLVRRSDARVMRDVNAREKWALMTGLPFAEDEGLLADEAQARAAWERCREELLALCRPFHRPLAYWEFDVPPELLAGVDPYCPRNNYEEERSALLRLGLPLTEQERRILAAEQAKNLQTSANSANQAPGGQE